ncbi:MAG: FprA family A-type flavoprotein [Myxococcota bacterium]
MAFRKISERIYWVGSIDWDRRLFDELIPLPMGTTYNSYLIRGEKNVLIDTVDPSKASELFENLKLLGIEKIDYIVCQHAEQDHSGSIPLVLERFPGSRVITNEKCRDLLIEHIGIKGEDVVVVKDEEEFQAPDITLKFLLAPWVHWPETMLTYFPEEKTLFTCDMFGSHLASHILYSDEDERFRLALKRYFAEIMLPFRANIRKHLDRISAYKVDKILPGHGLVHRKPEIAISYYREWSSDDLKPLVIIPYVSMHDSTEGMVRFLESELNRRGIGVVPINLAESDIGEFAMYLLEASTVIFGAPTVLAGPHPIVAYAAMILNALRPATRFVGFIGSYGWGGKTEEILKSLISNLRYTDAGTVFIKGVLKEEGRARLSSLADKILELNNLKKE